MTALSTTNPSWPPPPPGRSRHRARPGTPVIETAVIETAVIESRGDEAPTGPARRWFQHRLITLAAFLIFPPLGLWLAIRHHGLWHQRVAVRIAAVAFTIAFLIIPLATNPSDGGGTRIQDGAPIVGAFDPGPAVDPGQTDPTLGL